jgi:hypothetical protein
METLFDKFGGVRPMAEHLAEPPSTVQSWKTAGRVPAVHQARVLLKAEALRLSVTAEDVIFPLGRCVSHTADDARCATATSSGKADAVSARVPA